jgi:hypothetical protein
VSTPGALQLDFQRLTYTQRDGDFFPRIDDPWAVRGEPAAQLFERSTCSQAPSP